MLALCFAIFGVFGVVLVLVGANQDALAAALGIGLAESGLVSSVLALGIGSGMAAGGPLADRLPHRALALGSIWLASAALIGVSHDMSLARLLVHVFALGVGAGLANLVFNVAAVEHYGRDAPRRLLVMHSAVTLGAIAGPGLAAALGDPEHWTPSFRAAGFGYLVLSLWLLRVPLGAPHAARAAAGEAAGASRPRELAAFCVAAIAYLGVEAALTVFAVPYATEGLGLAGDRGRAAISAFWFGLLAGRMSALLWRGALDSRAIAASGLAAAVVLAVTASLFTQRIEWLFAAAGFALGPVFPLLVALAANTLPGRTGLATSFVAGLGSLGGFAVPWLVGAVGDRAGIGAAIGTTAAVALGLGLAGMVAHALRARPSPQIGLCSTCRHARRTANRRGSEFWQCGRAEHEPAYRRYPELPVRACAGHERA